MKEANYYVLSWNMPGSHTELPRPFHEKLREELLRSPSPSTSEASLNEAYLALSVQTDPGERVRIRHVLAQYLSRQAEFDSAHVELDHAVVDANGDSRLLDLTTYTRATVLHRQNNLELARTTISPLVESISAHDDLEFAARVHTLYAGILDFLGDVDEAADEFALAIKLRIQIGDERGLSVVYYNFAESCLRRDEDDLALEYFVRAYDIEKGLNDGAAMAQSACHIAILKARGKDATEAMQFADEAIAFAQQTGQSSMIAHVMANRATMYDILGDEAQRESSLIEVLTYLEKHPMDAVLGPVLGNLGSLYLKQKHYDKAEAYLQQALELARKNEYSYNEGFWLFCLGKLRVERGSFEDALTYLKPAIDILRSVKAHVYTLDAIHSLAQAHAGLQSNVEAFETLAEWTRTYRDEHCSELEERLKTVNALRVRERKEKEEEIYRLRNVELSQALDNLQHANAELRDLATDKDEFMAIAAHDLRNPLGDSRGMLQTIIGHYDVLDKSDVLSLCHDLLTLTMRMSNTVHAFLEVSRTDRRGTGLVIQPVDLTLIAERALERHIIRARSKSISTSVRIRKPLLWATGDASIIDAIVDNLITNSLKYSPSGSVITLEVDEDSSGPILRVFDNGPGVAEENRNLLFTKYATMGVKPTGGEESLGLGLYLAQRMATRMGARITYEERPEGGASFVLHLLA